MSKQEATVATPSNMFILDVQHSEEYSSFYIRVRDRVATNPLMRVTATKNGTIWLSIKGEIDMLPTVIEQLKAHYGIDKSLTGFQIPSTEASWGEAVTSTKDGLKLEGVFDVIVH